MADYRVFPWLEETKYNPYHDRLGRFSTGGNAVLVSLRPYTEKQKTRIAQATGGEVPGQPAPRARRARKPAMSPAETKLSTGEITNKQNLGGGINTTLIGEIDGQKVIIKPKSGLARGVMRHNIPPGHDLERELSGYMVAKRMGIDMPATVLRKTPEDRAMVQEFSEGTVGKNTSDGWRTARNLDEIALFDAVIGNEDRHAGNFLVRDSKIIPIDHGMSFPRAGSGWGNEYVIQERIHAGGKGLKTAEMKLLQELKADTKFRKKLTRALKDKKATEGVYKRIDGMLEAKEINEVRVINPRSF